MVWKTNNNFSAMIEMNVTVIFLLLHPFFDLNSFAKLSVYAFSRYQMWWLYCLPRVGSTEFKI